MRTHEHGFVPDPSWKYGPPPTVDCRKCGGALNDDNDCYDCGHHAPTREELRDAREA